MKILHICLASAYTEGMAYQDNLLPAENAKAGHTVTIISDCYKYESGKLRETEAIDKLLPDGTRLIRLKFDRVVNSLISNKVRKVPNLYEIITQIQPDVIMLHNLSTLEILSVARYKKYNPKVKLYADSHTDRNNSGLNWISMKLLHKSFYRILIKKAIQYFDKVFYISFETKQFLEEIYKVPGNLLEFYPLGGTVLSEDQKFQYRKEKRDELGIAEKDILLCHSGKMDVRKKTYEIISNFSKISNQNIKLILIGAFSEEIKEKVLHLMKNDKRIKFLGWQNSEELLKYIAASDLYLQPGSQSATMQSALCVGTPVLFENVKSHEDFMRGNAFAINKCEEMEKIFNQIIENPNILQEMSKKAYAFSKESLDYKILANRITI
ncbi:glycosyltransferase family 4 protein [Bacillus sp. FJAT-27251]|uniref:glycosyltransferase family 4 protein n=1 Tax=Bacillus sp. FJAT-27251 TaxID=1684142 RepID=UPI0006A7A7B7|nr:glycosyltransferase family 4 protein [Bacillus sp. FJAT-27251]